MVIDTSVIAAIFFDEPEIHLFLDKIDAAISRRISAATVLETAIVIERRLGDSAADGLDLFLSRYRIEVVPVDAEQSSIARRAWRKYGKGNHPASLNFGDCFSYALAKIAGEPLLAKGADFQKTDLELC
jgi:ribonuclease VapC